MTPAGRARRERATAAMVGTVRRMKGVPATQERDLGEDEEEFGRAVQAFKERTGVRFPTLSQYLFILKGLGYRRGGEGEAGVPEEVVPVPAGRHSPHSEATRQAVRALHWRGLKGREIAARLGCSNSTVSRALHWDEGGR